MNPPRWPLILGALLTTLAIALAAMGSHALPEIMSDPVRAHRFNTGLSMHQFNALGLALIGLACFVRPNNRVWQIAALILTAGIALFSGNLYLLAFMQHTPATWLTPLGGVLLMAAWLCFALGVTRKFQGPE